ncbi:MAG: (Fe-S)-binding protein [Planctomycetota bacterium]
MPGGNGELGPAPPERVVLFVPCYVDPVRPSAAIAAVEILEALGHRVEVRPDAVCCGQPFTNSGSAGEGEALARLWHERMAGAGAVVILSSSCAAHLQRRRPPPAPGPGAARGPEVWELCSFLERFHPDRSGGALDRIVCLHSSCHGLRESSADLAARASLDRIAGLRMLQARRADECCGFGGSFAMSFPELSIRIGEDRIREITALGVDEVVATDLSCLLHLEGIARAGGMRGSFRHIAELLREAMA